MGSGLFEKLILANCSLGPDEREQVLLNLKNTGEGLQKKRCDELVQILWELHLPKEETPVHGIDKIRVLCCPDGPLTPFTQIRKGLRERLCADYIVKTNDMSFAVRANHKKNAYLCKIDQEINQTVCSMMDCKPAVGDRKSEKMLSYRDKEDPTQWWLIISICGYIEKSIGPFVSQTGHVYQDDVNHKRCVICRTRTSKSCSCGRRLCCSLCQQVDFMYHSVSWCSGHRQVPECVN